MKRPNRFLIPAFILVFGLGFFLIKQVGEAEKFRQKQLKSSIENHNNFDDSPFNEKAEVVRAAGGSTRFLKAKDLAACGSFLKNVESDPSGAGNNFSTFLEQIKNHYQIKNETIDLVEYQLRERSNAEIIVQQIPSEELKNQVRVFKLAEDGFPDRVYDFPNSTKEVSLRLQGALTLGELTKKIEKFKMVNSDHSVLLFERSEGLVTKVDFTNGRNQLVCEDAACECLQF